MSRQRIKNIIEEYAKDVGYSFGTNIVPSELSSLKFPVLFWNAPKGEWSEHKARWRYDSTFYIVADIDQRGVTELLDELEGHMLKLHQRFQTDARVFADTTFTTEPLTDFDNSTARAIQVRLNIYCDGGC